MILHPYEPKGHAPMPRMKVVATMVAAICCGPLALANGLNFGFGEAETDAGTGNNNDSAFDFGDNRQQDDGTVGQVNQIDYTAPPPPANSETGNSAVQPPAAPGLPTADMPDNNYRPATPYAPVGPTNIFDTPTAQTCRASTINYAQSYVESYQTSPSLNSACGFKQLMEFNFFDSIGFSLSGLIDGAFCGFARSIVNPLIDTANEQISTINSYIPSSAELNVNGEWIISEEGMEAMASANWSIYGGQSVGGLINSGGGSYQYNYNFEGFNPDGDFNTDMELIAGIQDEITFVPTAIENGANLGNNTFEETPPSQDFNDYFNNLNNSTQPSTPSSSQTNDTDSSGASFFENQNNQPANNSNNNNNNGTSGNRIDLGGSSSQNTTPDAPVDNEGSVDWGGSVFENFFSN